MVEQDNNRSSKSQCSTAGRYIDTPQAVMLRQQLFPICHIFVLVQCFLRFYVVVAKIDSTSDELISDPDIPVGLHTDTA